MLYDPINFLHSHATYAALAAAQQQSPAVAIAYAPFGTGTPAGPFNLWLNNATEGPNCGDPYTVLRSFGGSHERNNPKVTINVQAETIGKSNLAAWSTANALYRALVLNNQERELRMLTIPGFKAIDNSADGSWMLVDAVTINLPAQVGRFENGRVKIVSNFSLGFYKVT